MRKRKTTWMRRLRCVVLAGALAASAAPAFADCAPPGLPMQQWLAMCGGVLQQLYAQGYGQGLTFQNFVMATYQQYMIASAGMAQQPAPGMQPGFQQCTLGESMCFSGWFRTCQAVGNGTMWITGSQRCR